MRVANTTCMRCGHRWASRTKKPLACPKCKSYDWRVAPGANKAAPARPYRERTALIKSAQGAYIRRESEKHRRDPGGRGHVEGECN
jgi:predicted  nucleic acid-binding Zn-ribbon protein